MIGLELSPAYLASRPAPDPLAAFFAPPKGAHVAIAQGPQNGLTIWTETGSDTAACLRFDGGNTTTRLSWRETLTCALRKIYPVAAFTLSPGWAQLQTSGSGLGGSYTGNRAVSSSSLAAVATIAVERAKPYDLWVYFTGRSSGAYARVDIDGAQLLVNAIDDPAALGFKAFSTYSASDMQRRRAVRVATGLTGAHVVTLSHGGAASPGGTTLMIEAVGLSADLSDDGILPPVWQAGKPYVMGDEVQWLGTFYAARATGVSGTTPPTHLTGIAGDGGIDWRADNRPTYPQFQAVDYPSEREYAARVVVAGAVTEIGGQTHGNEALVARQVTVDGAPFVPVTHGSGLHVGGGIGIVEQTTWQHAGRDDIADCRLQRRITPGALRHDVQVTATGPALQFDWFYLGMLPMVHWDGESAAIAFETLHHPVGPPVALADYAGRMPPDISLGTVSKLGLAGAGLTGALRFGCRVDVSGNLVTGLASFLRPNIDARAAAGPVDWTAKAYIAAQFPGGMVMQPGDVIGFASAHRLAITADQA
ncbi:MULTISPECIES: hypothetical protein [unclassified Yoonia]|uniref:hypothetical protein n=1 Tax=unclassified Yoonia TaxID=2629118 RepID=UPI002AFF7DCA|nr:MULTISPECIES: hypothetical protein [unclassified Yoonia]